LNPQSNPLGTPLVRGADVCDDGNDDYESRVQELVAIFSKILIFSTEMCLGRR
jgi:hypothetical protein